MTLAAAHPLKPWMRKKIRAVGTQGTPDEILSALSELSRSHRCFVPTDFEAGVTISASQNGRSVAFPAPLQRENHRTILTGYVENMYGKYTLDGFCQVADGDVVVDCGAYVGGFARGVAEQASRVLVVEPAPENRACCQQNLGTFENVDILPIGLFDTDGVLPFQLSNSSVDHSFLAPDRGATGRVLMTPVFRLDTLMSSLDVDHIDFLKLEAEGAEIEAVRGLGDLRPAKIAIDVSPERNGESPSDELQAMLGPLGYEFKQQGYTLFGVHRKN